jgi:mannan polymerase II complex MNN11 subunit
MHFAMPPRKTSRPPPYAARQQSGFRLPPVLRNLLRRDKLRVIVLAILGFLTLFWLLGRTGGNRDSNAPSLAKVAIGSGAPVVIVTVLDPKGDPGWVAKLKHNREDYAKRHGTSHRLCSAVQCTRRGMKLTPHRLQNILPLQRPVPS